MAGHDRNLGKPEVFVPLEGGLWTCPACGTDNPSVTRVCPNCGQLVRFRRVASGVYPGVFFTVSAVAFFLVCTAHGRGLISLGAGYLSDPGSKTWAVRALLGGFNWIAVVLVAIGLYFFWKRPTGRQYMRELREREF